MGDRVSVPAGAQRLARGSRAAPAGPARIALARVAAGAPADVLALQRAAGNRATVATLARCATGHCTCGGAHEDELLDDEQLRPH